MNGTLPSIEGLKDQAKRLRARLAETGETVGHSKALELIAAQYGYKDWNTLHAAVGNRPPACPVALGDQVGGFYLGQPFRGTVIGTRTLMTEGKYRVTLEFDEPVDVVTFDSFSAFRKRVTCIIDRDGNSSEKTSDGRPHMQLRVR